MLSLKKLTKKINIISFDVPYPPNYGGVIDVFYKIKALKELGVAVHLHTFEYGRTPQQILEKYCDSVCYYKRNIHLKNVFSPLPFLVKTQKNKTLITNLQANNYPILFEGLHSTYPLLKTVFKNRTTLVRAHNIEHNYYKALSKSETRISKKIFFGLEAFKLKKYQKNLNSATHILSISPLENSYFSKKFPSKAIYIPAFHPHQKVNTCLKKGDFALYRGNLNVSENTKACKYLIEIFAKIAHPLIIASDFKNPKITNSIKKHENIRFQHTNSHTEIANLVQKAHINILPTFQNTGIKLKLLHALHAGKHCLVNKAMVEKTGLETLCAIAHSKTDFIAQINKLFQKEFTQKQIEERKIVLQNFNTQNSAKKIIALL